MVAFRANQAKLDEAHKKGAASAKLQGYEVLNLGRQLGDMGTMAAMGASPLMILTTQGAQVAEIFGVAASRTGGLKATFMGLAGDAVALAKRCSGLILAGAGLGALGVALVAIYQEGRKTAEALKALEDATRAANHEIGLARDAMSDTSVGAQDVGEKSLAAVFGVKAFGGEVGEAARKLYDFAAAAKAATVNGLMAQRAALGSKISDLESRAPEQRRGAMQGALTPQNVVNHLTRRVTGDLASLYTGGQSDRDNLQALAQAKQALKDLERTAHDAMRTDLKSWADDGAAAMRRAAGAADEHSKKLTKTKEAQQAAVEAARENVNAFVDQVAASQNVIEALQKAIDKREKSTRELILEQGALDAARAPTEALATTILGLAAANAKAADEAERLAQIGKTLKTPKALGNDAGLKLLRRTKELKEVSPDNRGLLLFIHALEDFKEAQDKAAEVTRQATETAERLADAQRDVWSTAYENARQTRDNARSELQSAVDDERAAIQGRIGDLQSLIKTLGDFRSSLDFGEIGGQSATMRYSGMKAEFQRIAANDNSQIASFGPEFLAVSKASAKTALEYARDVAMVKRATQEAIEKAGVQIDVEQSSLKALNDSVAGLGIINASVLSGAERIALAISSLAIAQSAMNMAGGRMDPQWGAIANVGVNRQLADATGYTGAFGGGLFQSWITSEAGAGARDVARQVLTTAGQADRIQGFATGGLHDGGWRVVGEEGPELEATGPSRIFNADDTRRMLGSDNADVVAELNGLRAEIRQIMVNTGASARSGRNMENVLERLSFFVTSVIKGKSGDEAVRVREAA